MTADGTSTINQLVELFQLSRSRKEWVNLSMESKDGKDSLTFSIRNPAGAPAGQSRTWTPGSTSPWAWPSPPPWTTFQRRRKTTSEWRRDQKRKEEFIAKKSSIEVKEEVKETHDKLGKTTLTDPEDEIELGHISSKGNNEAKVKGSTITQN